MSFSQPPFWAVRNRGHQPLHVRSVVVTEPAIEPLSLNEVKQALKITTTANDAHLAGLIIAARRQVEKDLADACLVPTVVDTWLDRAPQGRALEIPRWPLQSVASVKSYDQDDVETTLAADTYLVDTVSRPGRLILNYDASWPSSLRPYKSIVVRHTSGFGSAAKTVSSITRSGTTATVTLPLAHGWASSKRITLAGIDQAEYNGTFEITVTGTATFTVQVTGTPATPATGVMTATDLGIPQLYTLAVEMLVTHWNDIRGPVNVGNIVNHIPLTYQALLSDAPVGMA